MDIVLFESQITYTKEVMNTLFKAWFFKSKLWLIFLLPIAPIIVGIVMIIESGDFTALALGISLEIIMLLIIFIRYKVNSKYNYARACEQNNGQEVTNTVQFFDDKILITNNLTGNRINYDYSFVKKIVDDKQLILLLTKAKISIIIDKTLFVVGNAEGLIAFVKTKLNTSQNA